MRGLALALALIFSAALPAAEKTEACLACHGKDGTSTVPLTPSLGAQPAFFVVAQLFLARDGRRNKAPTPMDEFAKGLSDDELRAYAELFAGLPPPVPAGAPEGERFERGRRLAASRNCAVCHNPDFSGRDQMPRLAGQREDYLLKALRDYKAGLRVGYGSASMPEEVAHLSDAELADLAHFLAHLR